MHQNAFPLKNQISIAINMGDRECLFLMHAVGLNAYIQDYEIWCQETRAIILWYSAKHLELLRCNSHLTDGGTDRWTDMLVANAVLNYFMQP